MSGVLPTIYLPSDMQALLARLFQSAQGTDTSVRQCSQIDQGTRAAWGLFFAQVVDFCSISTGFFFGSRVDQGEQLERELYAWQQKLAGMGCSMTVPIFNPANPTNDPSQNSLVQALRYGAVIATAVGGAYVVGKVISLLPKGRGR
jgi:hypothetical protein